MALKEVYTLLDRHFGGGCNAGIFELNKYFSLSGIYLYRMVSDCLSYQFGYYIVDLIMQVLKPKTCYLRFRVTASQAVLVYLGETNNRLKLVHSKNNCRAIPISCFSRISISKHRRSKISKLLL